MFKINPLQQEGAMEQPNWVVVEATPWEDHTIDLLSADGQRKAYDAAPLLGIPFYSPLSSQPFFLTASELRLDLMA